VTASTHTVLGTRVKVDEAERIRAAAEVEDRSVSSFLKRAGVRDADRVLATAHQRADGEHERRLA
jgi:uncharacterized protein (DUF1778 family)